MKAVRILGLYLFLWLSALVGTANAGPVLAGWYQSNAWPGLWAFYDGTAYTVYFNPADKSVVFWDEAGDCWTDPLGPPSPGILIEDYVGDLPTGVDTQRVDITPPGYAINGNNVSVAQAFQAVEQGLPNEVGKGWVTAIGPADFLTKVETELAKSPLTARVLFQGYEPSDWSTARFDLGGNQQYKTAGRVLFIQDPTGRAVHAQYDLDDAKAFEKALTLAVATFDATKVPDLREDGIVAQVTRWVKENPYMAGGLVVLAFLLFTKRREDI